MRAAACVQQTQTHTTQGVHTMSKDKSLVGSYYKGQRIIEDDGYFIRVADGTVYARMKGGGFT
jgi:hypothetical protein